MAVAHAKMIALLYAAIMIQVNHQSATVRTAKPTKMEEVITAGIVGPGSVCIERTHQYTYSPGSNFPYHWKWKVNSDAKIVKSWASNDTYYCDVKFGKTTATVVFEQSNPPGVPQVHNQSKMITVKKCDEKD